MPAHLKEGVLLEFFNILTHNTYLNVGKINSSYSFAVASCTMAKAGCKTAASTSAAFISCCKNGHTCCHQSFCIDIHTESCYGINITIYIVMYSPSVWKVMHPSMYCDRSELFEWDPSCLLHREIGVHALLDRYLCGGRWSVWIFMCYGNVNLPEVLNQL